MSRKLTLVDRLRIARVLWTMYWRTQDLPGRVRKDVGRELRANLRAAAAEVGSAEAVRRLGNLHRLAADYLDAEYGDDQPRPHWLTGVVWGSLVWSLILLGFTGSFISFMEGIWAADPDGDPNSAGTYVWKPLGALGPVGEFRRYDDGGFEFFLAPSLWMIPMPFVIYLLASRGWRMLGIWRHRHDARLAARGGSVSAAQGKSLGAEAAGGRQSSP